MSRSAVLPEDSAPPWRSLALLCAARFPVVETAAMARADRSKPQIDEAIGALPDSSQKKKEPPHLRCARELGCAYRGFLAPQAVSAKPLKQCLQVHESGQDRPLGAFFYARRIAYTKSH